MRHNELSWAVGLFEGEGCFTPVTVQGKVYPRAILAMADGEIVLRFQAAVGCGHIRIERRSGRIYPDKVPRKDLYRWEVQARADFDRFAKLMRPHLGARRIEALDAMLARVTPRQRKQYSRKRQSQGAPQFGITPPPR